MSRIAMFPLARSRGLVEQAARSILEGDQQMSEYEWRGLIVHLRQHFTSSGLDPIKVEAELCAFSDEVMTAVHSWSVAGHSPSGGAA